MSKNTDDENKNGINKNYSTDLWREIRLLYESKHKHAYAKIKQILTIEFDLKSFPSRSTVQRRAKNEDWERYGTIVYPKGNRYGDDFWICVKSIYESHSKLTHKKLRDLVQNELQIDYFPTSQAISLKVKTEGWKRLDSLLKNGDSTLQKQKRCVKKNSNSKVNVQDLKNNIIQFKQLVNPENYDLDVSTIDGIKEAEKVAKMRISNVLMSSRNKTQKLAETILKSRSRMKTINEIGDLLSDRLMELFALQSSTELRTLIPPEMMDSIIQEQIGMGRIVNIFNELSYNRRESVKFELSLYGVHIEDLRDNNNDVRIKNLNDDSAYEKQRERLISQIDEVVKRRQYIDSGGLQKEVDDHIQKMMDEMNEDEIEVDYIEMDN